jgi:hypothetical protein
MFNFRQGHNSPFCRSVHKAFLTPSAIQIRSYLSWLKQSQRKTHNSPVLNAEIRNSWTIFQSSWLGPRTIWTMARVRAVHFLSYFNEVRCYYRMRWPDGRGRSIWRTCTKGHAYCSPETVRIRQEGITTLITCILLCIEIYDVTVNITCRYWGMWILGIFTTDVIVLLYTYNSIYLFTTCFDINMSSSGIHWTYSQKLGCKIWIHILNGVACNALIYRLFHDFRA